MPIRLTLEEQALLEGKTGPATAMAMRIVVETAKMLGAENLVRISSAHIDGCLYHGDSGTEFAERLVNDGGTVAVPTTLNVGSLDLLNSGTVRLPSHEAAMARRMMATYVRLGARQTWTCAPYQAGHRPALGENVAWGESNAVVFCNSVLGARTNRYGDYLDICAAITGHAPYTGLHITKNRAAKVLIDLSSLNPSLLAEDAFYPVLGAWLGKAVGTDVAAIVGLPAHLTDDRLKSLGASVASTGAVGLFHIVVTTPEATTLDAAFQGERPVDTILLSGSTLQEARRSRKHFRTAL
jgi:predicted aconitase